MKKILILMAVFTIILTGCNKNEIEDEEEISYKLMLNREYINEDSSTIYLSDDGTFKFKECIEKNCVDYEGVMDHADNGMLLYFDESKRIDEGTIIADNKFVIKGKTFTQK